MEFSLTPIASSPWQSAQPNIHGGAVPYSMEVSFSPSDPDGPALLHQIQALSFFPLQSPVLRVSRFIVVEGVRSVISCQSRRSEFNGHVVCQVELLLQDKPPMVDVLNSDDHYISGMPKQLCSPTKT